MELTKILETPVQSPTDKKEYRAFQLNNGIKVVLIKSAKDESLNENVESAENLAALAFCVSVGSFDDPPSVPGLTHFLEHMIFRGSEKYPLENEYTQFVNLNGGDVNAMTDYEYTIYYLNIVENKLQEALDRFSHLFISPLMLRDAMQREREAVDSEFHNVLNSDKVRYNSFIVSLINDNQRGSVFDWGNLKSLKDDISDEDLYKTVHDFRIIYYVANRMNLSIQSSLELDDLQQMVETYFSPIKSGEDEAIIETDYHNVFKPEFSEKMYFIKPVLNQNKLLLAWVLPSVQKNYRCRPMHYIQHIMHHSGKGGLCTYLQKSLFATNVFAEIDDQSFGINSMFTLFRLEIKLTDEGYKNINKVLEALFSYLLLLKTAPREKHRQLYEEIQQVKHSFFKYRKEDDNSSNVEKIATHMKFYDVKNIFTGDQYMEYDEDLITSLIEKLNQKTFNMILLTDKHDSYDKKEKWFGTEYAEVDFPETYTQLWNDRQLNPELFHLPVPNPFISTNFDIYVNCKGSSPEHPVQVLKDDVCEVWHKLDDNFKLPFTYLKIYLISPKAMSSVFNNCMTTMYVKMFNYYAIESLYPALYAGQNWKLSDLEKGIIINLTGYSAKIHVMIDEITRKIKNIVETVDESSFNLLKAELKKSYFNLLMTGDNVLESILDNILEEKNFSSYETYSTFDTLKFEDFQKFAGKFLKNLKIQMLAQGNITKKQAIEFAEQVRSDLDCNPIQDESLLQRRTRQLPAETNYLKIKSLLAIDENSTIIVYYQIGKRTIRKSCLLDLLVVIMETPLFDILRNKEQLGYSVNCYKRENKEILGIHIDITSQENKHPVDVVNDRIENCHHRNNSNNAMHLMNAFNKDSYIYVCLISSTIGILGSIYQIFIRKEEIVGSPRDSKFLGRKIIVCLAYSDLFASIGIFVRSALWNYVKDLMPSDDDTVSVLFCSITSAWIQCFYTATWLWTLVYAINMRRSLLNQPSRQMQYHIFVWTVSVLLTSVGLTSLYFPDADCHDIHDVKTTVLRILPNYLMNYGPIIAVMVVNPIIYFKSSQEVQKQLMMRYGQMTNNERRIQKVFKIKFSLINIIFYICWLPNVINGLLLWIFWFHLPVKVIIVSWYLEAILNPLQAFFNALVYRKWTNKINCFSTLKIFIQNKFKINENKVAQRPTELSPLLHNPNESHSRPRTLFSKNQEDLPPRHSVNSCPCN
ncbi:unnamed protein product [Diamesa serratosioi]